MLCVEELPRRRAGARLCHHVMKCSSKEAKGDQREGNVIVGAARQVIGSILPGHSDK